ncbi:hypothetical protein FRC11_003888, partial [Ceratobasidium sp. 423]
GQKHGFLMAPAAHEIHFEWVQAKEQKEQEKAQSELKKCEEASHIALECLRITTNVNHAFTRMLAKFKRGQVDNLQDLAAALGLEYEGITKEHLYEGVVTHFKQNPELKSHPKYQALFLRRHAAGGSTGLAMY